MKLDGGSIKSIIYGWHLHLDLFLGIKDLKESTYHPQQSLRKVSIHLLRQSSREVIRVLYGKEIKSVMMDFIRGLKLDWGNHENAKSVELKRLRFIIGLTSIINIIGDDYQIGNVFV